MTKIIFTAKHPHLFTINAVKAVNFFKISGFWRWIFVKFAISSGECFLFSPHSLDFLQKRNIPTWVRTSHLLLVNNFLFHCAICNNFLDISCEFKSELINVMKNKRVENLKDLRFLAVNSLFSPLKRWKKIIHRYQREAVKIKYSPLKTANLSKIHRKKIYSDFYRWFIVRFTILSVELLFFIAFFAFNAKSCNSYIFPPHSPQILHFLAIFSVDTSTRVKKIQRG